LENAKWGSKDIGTVNTSSVDGARTWLIGNLSTPPLPSPSIIRLYTSSARVEKLKSDADEGMGVVGRDQNGMRMDKEEEKVWVGWDGLDGLT